MRAVCLLRPLLKHVGHAHVKVSAALAISTDSLGPCMAAAPRQPSVLWKLEAQKQHAKSAAPPSVATALHVLHLAARPARRACRASWQPAERRRLPELSSAPEQEDERRV